MLEVPRAILRRARRTAPATGLRGLACLVVLVSVLQTARVDAYIDPGAGSYLFQLAIGGALAALYTGKQYWARIRGLIGSLRPGSRAGAGREPGRDRGTLD